MKFVTFFEKIVSNLLLFIITATLEKKKKKYSFEIKNYNEKMMSCEYNRFLLYKKTINKR